MESSFPQQEVVLSDTLKNTPLLTFIIESGGSVRLKNRIIDGLRSGKIHFKTVGEYFDAGSDADLSLFRIRGFGIRTAIELRRLVQSALSKEITNEINEINPENYLLTNTKNEGISEETIMELLQRLTYKERRVMTFRFGLEGNQSMKLTDLGEIFGVTKQRILQIEKKAIRKIRAISKKELNAFLSEKGTDIFSRISINTDVLGDRDVRKRIDMLTPVEKFAIFLVYKSIEGWLENVALRVDGGWVGKDTNIEILSEVSKYFYSLFENINGPFLLKSLGKIKSIDMMLLHNIIALSSDYSNYSGYLVHGSLRKRIRRAIRVHLLFGEQNRRMPIPLCKLREDYVKRFPDDNCSIRDLQIVMRGAPHLFLNMYEEGWIALGDIGEKTNILSEEVVEDVDVVPGDKDAEFPAQDNIYENLRAILDEKGPLPFDELRNDFVKRTKWKYSPASVGPILLIHEDFVRFSPGVYGLRTQIGLPHIDELALKVLMDVKQLKLYCHARWANEPIGQYPMWTPLTELAWAIWAKRNGIDKLLSSLLAIADITRWPLKNDELNYWLRIKNQIGNFQLEENNPIGLTETLPSLGDVATVALFALARGNVSWISANRVRGLRMDDRHVHSVLSLLIGLGVLAAPSHWQRQHLFIEGSYEIVDALTAELQYSPSRKWTPNSIDMLLEYTDINRDFGWVNKIRLLGLVNAIVTAAGRVMD